MHILKLKMRRVARRCMYVSLPEMRGPDVAGSLSNSPRAVSLTIREVLKPAEPQRLKLGACPCNRCDADVADVGAPRQVDRCELRQTRRKRARPGTAEGLQTVFGFFGHSVELQAPTRMR